MSNKTLCKIKTDKISLADVESVKAEKDFSVTLGIKCLGQSHW